MNSPSPLPESPANRSAPRSLRAIGAAALAVVFGAPTFSDAAEPTVPVKVAMARNKNPEALFKDGLRWIENAKSDEVKRKYWIRLAETVPAQTLKNSELIDPKFAMEIIRMAAENAIEKDPFGFLENAYFCTDLNDYKKYVVKAANNAADIDPKSTLEFKDLFGSFDGGSKVLEKIQKNLLAKDTRDKLVKK